MTAPVDISPEAVEDCAKRLHYEEFRTSAATLRALRAALTARDDDAAKWRALVASDRITCMGSAKLLDLDTPYGHATFNFWTGSAARGEFAGGDGKDRHRRQQFDLYVAKALRNAK
jgi:hypothetical protein